VFKQIKPEVAWVKRKKPEVSWIRINLLKKFVWMGISQKY